MKYVPFRKLEPLSPVKAASPLVSPSSYCEVPVPFSVRLVSLAARHCDLVRKEKEKLTTWAREVARLGADSRMVGLKKALSLKIPTTRKIVAASLNPLLETVDWTLLAEGYTRMKGESVENMDEVIKRVIEIFKKMVKMLENVTTGEYFEVVPDLEDSLAAWEERLLEAETAGTGVLQKMEIKFFYKKFK